MNQCVIPSCDVPTRWNSTYLMIKRCIQLQVVIGMYLPSDESLEKINITLALLPVSQLIQGKLNKYYEEVLQKNVYVIATFMDPRYKT